MEFVGVDIFFVVSGYLISGLIVEHLKRGHFSFWDFYARRTRRIYPALFVMILIVLTLGYFVLTPGEYVDLGRSAIFSSAFLANVYFWFNTGYFDRPAEAMPLLHLWSIAVEEQFYLVWPLSLVLIWRYVKLDSRATVIALATTTLLLWVLSIVLTLYDAKSAFYLPFARLWQFTLGALLLALPGFRDTRRADVLSLLGMLTMIGAIFLSRDARLGYPNYWTTLPCLGAAAVIAAGERSLVGRFLSRRPIAFLGRMSYSLYLWHWPLIVFYAYYLGTRNFSVVEQIALILSALAIAYVSWRFVEQPARRRREHPRRHVFYGATLAVTSACLAFLVVANAGFPDRVPEEMRALANARNVRTVHCIDNVVFPGRGEPACVVGVPWKSASKRAVLWGDSHGQHLMPLLDVPSREQNTAVALWLGCAPFINKSSPQRQTRNLPPYVENCEQSRSEFLAWIASNPDIDLVILANAWGNFPNSLYGNGVFTSSDSDEAAKYIETAMAQFIEKIDPQRYPVLIVGDIPRVGFDPLDCVFRSGSDLWRNPSKKCREFFVMPDRPIRLHPFASRVGLTTRLFSRHVEVDVCWYTRVSNRRRRRDHLPRRQSSSPRS